MKGARLSWGALAWPASLRRRLDRLKTSSIGYRLARGALWSMTGTVVLRSLAMVSSVVVARILGKDIFGEMGVIQGTIGMFGTLAGFGMGITATKYVAEFRVNDPARAGRIIGLTNSITWVCSTMMAIALAVSASWLCEHTLAAPSLAKYLRAGALILLFSSVNGAQKGTLYGFEAFKSIASINAITGIIITLASIVGALLFGLWGLVLGLAGSEAATCLMNFYAIRRRAATDNVKISWRCREELSIAWRFSVPALLSGLVVSPINWACIAILVNTPGGYGEMGIYNAAIQWRGILFFLPTIFMQAVLPIMASSRVSSGKESAFESSYQLTQSAMVMAGFPACILVMATAHWIMPIYGRDFASGASALVCAALVTLIRCIGAANGPAIESKGRMWLALAINATYSGLLIIGALILLPTWGAAGLLFASAMAYIVVTLWGFRYLRHELPPGMFRRALISLCLAMVFAGICAVTPQRFSLILAPLLTIAAAVIGFRFLIEPKVRRAALAFLHMGYVDALGE